MAVEARPLDPARARSRAAKPAIHDRADSLECRSAPAPDQRFDIWPIADLVRRRSGRSAPPSPARPIFRRRARSQPNRFPPTSSPAHRAGWRSARWQGHERRSRPHQPCHPIDVRSTRPAAGRGRSPERLSSPYRSSTQRIGRKTVRPLPVSRQSYRPTKQLEQSPLDPTVPISPVSPSPHWPQKTVSRH